MRIGARTLKTGIAVTIALLIPQLLNMPTGSTLAAISAVFALQPSVMRSITTLRNRLLANLIGGIIAIIVTLTIGNQYVIVGLSAALLIAVLNKLDLGPVIGQSTVTLVLVMMTTEQNFILFAFYRLFSTFIGVLVAFVVNTLFFPPKYEEKLYHLIDYTTTDIIKWIRASIRKNVEYPVLKKDLKWVQSELSRTDVYYSLFKDEGHYLRKKQQIPKLRKVVVYRQIISTTRIAFHLAKTLHTYENSFNHFPDEMRILIRERLETLVTAHEQILLKFNGRVQPGSVNFFAYKASLRREFMESFFNEASLEAYMDGDYGQSNSVIHIMSAILKYEEYIEHLNNLVTSFKKNARNPETNISNIDHIEQ